MAEERRLGPYKLLEITARGEMLTRYRAYDTQRNRPVLFTQIHSRLQEDIDLVNRVRERAQALTSLHHPNMVSNRRCTI